jgi:hypothetical protein
VDETERTNNYYPQITQITQIKKDILNKAIVQLDKCLSLDPSSKIPDFERGILIGDPDVVCRGTLSPT